MNSLNKLFSFFIFAAFTITCFSMPSDGTKQTELSQAQKNPSLFFEDNGIKIEIGIDKEPCLSTFFQYGVLWIKITNTTPTPREVPDFKIPNASTKELQGFIEKRSSTVEKILFWPVFWIENDYLAKHKNSKYQTLTLSPNETVTQFIYLFPIFFRRFKEVLLTKSITSKQEFETSMNEEDDCLITMIC